jgi:ribosomal protein S18 acetylase RimI-like enzyme
MNGPRLSIVRASVDDVDAVAELFDLYRQFYKQPPDAKKCRHFIEKRITRSESVVLLAFAADGEDALGFVQLYPTFCSVAASRIFVLYDLFVRTRARGRGAGRRLMQAAQEHARAAGASSLQLQTHHSNVIAQRLYESLGFKREEEFYTYVLKL